MKIISECVKIFKILDQKLTLEQKEVIKNTYYFNLDIYQDTLGKYITANFLKENTALHNEFINAGILLAEDMAMFIITLYYMNLKTESGELSNLID